MVKTLSPRKYDEVAYVGHLFCAGNAVVMDLASLPADEAMPFVDFATGLIVGTGGAMERLAPRVFLLLPAGMVGPDRPRHPVASPTHGADHVSGSVA